MPEKQEYINGSDAYRRYIEAGGGISYPTFLKLLKDKQLAIQPTGKQGAYIVHHERFKQWLKEEVENAA